MYRVIRASQEIDFSDCEISFEKSCNRIIKKYLRLGYEFDELSVPNILDSFEEYELPRRSRKFDYWYTKNRDKVKQIAEKSLNLSERS